MCNCVCFKKGHKLICDSVHCLTQRCPVGINITVQYVVFLNKKKKKYFSIACRYMCNLKKIQLFSPLQITKFNVVKVSCFGVSLKGTVLRDYNVS